MKREREMDESMHNSCDHDTEFGSHSTIFNHLKCSPPHTREFEFYSSSSQRDTTTSPADELFYKGKLLPLNLPPRLEMVEKFLQSPNTCNYEPESYGESDVLKEFFFSTPLLIANNHTLSSNTQFSEYATEEASSFSSDENSKRSWTRKLKLMRQSSLSSKLKASRAFLRSFFAKSSCSSEASAATSRIIKRRCVPQVSEDAKVAKESFGQIQSSSSLAKNFNKENNPCNERGHHRRSCSSSISNSSNGFQELQIFKRGNSSCLEIENSIQAAIAHCKRSQQQFQTRKIATDLGFCSLSASKVIYEEQERPELCRG